MKNYPLSARKWGAWLVLALLLTGIGSLIYIVYRPLKLTLFTRINAYDLVFVLAAIAFNLLIVGIFVAQKNGWAKPAKVFGMLWLLLTFPFAVVFVRYLTEGKRPGIMVSFGLVFLYILVEFLLDYVLKIDFRQKWITHAPYIVLEYIALFSLIGIAFNIDRTWGYLVSISFWILLASLIYLYWDKIKIGKRKKRTPL